MNPENNNSLSNPFASNNANPTTPNFGGLSMSDNLASAQDSLASAGMSAGPSTGGAIGLDQIAAADDNGSSALPLVDGPLVPAAPVPGSIGSAISMPSADPVAAPAFNSASSFNTPSVPGNDPMSGFGAAPASSMPTQPVGTMPEATPAPVSAPYNPFAAPAPEAQAPSALGAADSNVQPAGAMPAPATQPTAPATDPAHTAPAVQPMPMGASPAKSQPAFNLLTIIFGIAALGLLVLTITFFVLWNNEKKNLKPVYYPQVSGGTNSAVKSISCQRNETRENPAGAGKTLTTISFTDNDLSAYSSTLSLDFANPDEAAAARDANAAAAESLAALVGGTLAVNNSANGNNFSYTITSQDSTKVAAADAQNVIYGTTDGSPSLALADIQAKFEADGYVCTEE